MKEEIKGCVYLLRNLVNGKGYVGQHKNVLTVGRRWAGHIKRALRPGFLIHAAIRKYGVKNFSAEVLWCGAVEKLNEKEVYYIKKLHTFVDDQKGGGYNLNIGGGQCTSYSKLSRRRMSKAQNRRYEDPEQRAKKVETSNRVYAEDPTLRGRISESLKARHKADPTYRKRAARPKSKEFKQAVSALFKGLWADESWRETRTAAMLITNKRELTSEQRFAMSERAKAQWACKKSRAKLMAGLKRAFS